MIAELVARLTAACPDLKGVEMAEDLDFLIQARGTAAADKHAYVIPYRERAKPNSRATGGHLQQVQEQVLTALVLRRHDDNRGSARAGLFDTLKGTIEQALTGWAPPGYDPFELVGGEGTPLGNGVSVYIQTWETARLLEGNPT